MNPSQNIPAPARVRSGLEVLLTEHLDLLGGRRIGLCCNPTTVLPDLRHAVDVMHAHPEIDLCRLFGPEHGVRGTAQYMVSVNETADPGTGLPMISLYGADEASLRPRAEQLDGLDVLVFDIQDIGTRYYTYVYTLAYCLEACAAAAVRVIVCDRPNPIRGDRREGNLVDTARYRSFVGRFALPNRHGLTTGELAAWFRDRMDLGDDPDVLTVIPCQGWRRSQWFDQTGLPWIMPSPNMPTLDTALVYPGQCLLEGTNVSEGRGTTRPFELCGAPWIDSRRLSHEMQRLTDRWGLNGIAFRECAFEPTFDKYAGEVCNGLQFHITDRDSYHPLASSVTLLLALKRLYPQHFDWRREPYEFVTDRLAIDLLSGDTGIRELVDANGELPELADEWRKCEREFTERAAPYLLYS